tara:strand:- start:63 stop:413 length:351 start_codon:yes stop_codon:yes gene_type:complete
MNFNKQLRRKRIKQGIRTKINGTKIRPRISIYKSNKAIYSQIINDELGNTLVSCSSIEIEKKGKKNMIISKEVGVKLAKKAVSAGIKNVLFDRSGYKYHGKIKSFAEGAREGGLNF